jgi:hypothetical protein
MPGTVIATTADITMNGSNSIVITKRGQEKSASPAKIFLQRGPGFSLGYGADKIY